MEQLFPQPMWKIRSVQSNGRTLVIIKVHHWNPHYQRVKMTNGPSYWVLTSSLHSGWGYWASRDRATGTPMGRPILRQCRCPWAIKKDPVKGLENIPGPWCSKLRVDSLHWVAMTTSLRAYDWASFRNPQKPALHLPPPHRKHHHQQHPKTYTD